MPTRRMESTTCPRPGASECYTRHNMLDQRHCDGWRMCFMWDEYVIGGAPGAGRRVLGLDSTYLLDRRFNGRSRKMGESSGFRRQCFQLFAGACRSSSSMISNLA